MINPLNQLVGKPFVHTLVFLRTPKCASSTIEKAIGLRNLLCRERKALEAALSKDKKYDGKFDVTHATPAELFRIFGRGIGNFFTFSCCRNPYEKAISQWAFSVKNKFGRFYGFKENPSFLEYCEFLYKNRHDKNYWPAILQTEYTHGCLRVDYVIRFESLQESWSQMLKTFDISGLPLTLTHENQNAHLPYQEYYCERAKEIILDVYHKDFEKLNYPQILT
jgi:hypothetical protein